VSNRDSETILQAPHRPSDLFTDVIARKLFLEGDFAAVAVSTTHRNSVDLSKETDSFFNSFTEAVATAYQYPKIIQLHAFDTVKHNLDCDLILSATAKSGGVIYDNIARSLTDEFIIEGFKISQFPKDVSVLGGLKNVNAKVLYSTNSEADFFHVETSMKMREGLRNSKYLRKKFTGCFINPP